MTKTGFEWTFLNCLHQQLLLVDIWQPIYESALRHPPFVLIQPNAQHLCNNPDHARDATRRDATRRDATRRDATRRDATRRDATRRDATRRDATRRDATRRDATRRDATRRDATRRDATRRNVDIHISITQR